MPRFPNRAIGESSARQLQNQILSVVCFSLSLLPWDKVLNSLKWAPSTSPADSKACCHGAMEESISFLLAWYQGCDFGHCSKVTAQRDKDPTCQRACHCLLWLYIVAIAV